MAFESGVDLLLDPVSPLGLVSLDVLVVDEGSKVFQTVEVQEQLVHIVAHFLLIRVLQSESLLIELANSINTLGDVLVIDKRLGCLIGRELEQEYGVAFVGDGCLGRSFTRRRGRGCYLFLSLLAHRSLWMICRSCGCSYLIGVVLLLHFCSFFQT